MDRVELTLREYEEVRSHATRFFIVPGHEVTAVERVVEQNPRFAVVEKLDRGAEVAEQRDPRRGTLE